MYIKITNGIPEIYSIGNLRRDKPNTSFPKNPSNELLAELGVFPVVSTPKPKVDYNTQTCKEVDPVEIDGVWTQQWLVQNKTQEEIETIVRNRRNELLSNSDWTQINDATVNKDEWGGYRQALRDLPQQVGFPFDVVWPEPPKDN